MPRPEPGELAPDFALIPSLMLSDNEPEFLEDYLAGDMLSLKGQVWPGMGKMDLANEEMKRTRNQRKPKSAIDKMRRTSEGIEPTQVVLTPDFEVERVKGVYDSSSPIPGQEESVGNLLMRFDTIADKLLQTPPRRITKPRRKKEALQDLPPNIPRHRSKPADLGNVINKRRRVKYDHDQQANFELVAPRALGSPWLSNDVFRDAGARSGAPSPLDLSPGLSIIPSNMFDSQSTSTTSQSDERSVP